MISFVLTPRAAVIAPSKTERFTLEALKSFYPAAEILFYSDDDGVCQLAEEFGASVAKKVNKISGKPSIFCGLRWAAETAKHETIVYLNSDIVLTSGLEEILSVIKTKFGHRWLMSCQRMNLKYTSKSHKLLLNKGKEKLIESSILYRKSGMDIFAFDKNLIISWDAPMLPVGYPGWDSYFISIHRTKKVPIIDCTDSFTIFHQTHPIRYFLNYRDFKSILSRLGIANLNTLIIANYKLGANLVPRYSLIGDFFGTRLSRFTIGSARLFIKFMCGK